MQKIRGDKADLVIYTTLLETKDFKHAKFRNFKLIEKDKLKQFVWVHFAFNTPSMNDLELYR